MKYLLLSVEDAHRIANTLVQCSVDSDSRAIALNLLEDTGGDFEEIAASLKKTEFCVACSHEGMKQYCTSLDSQKTGRRIHRLIERAQKRREVPVRPAC